MGLMYLGLILRGMGVACISATKFGMIADSIEYGEYKTGTRAEGFVYSAASLGVRVGSALASAVIGWVLGAYGYGRGVASSPIDCALWQGTCTARLPGYKGDRT